MRYQVAVRKTNRTKEAMATFLNVSYSDKDIVKAMGAHWDASECKWFVPRGRNTTLFKRWIPVPDRMLSVDTPNGPYTALVSENGSVRQIKRHGDFKEAHFESEVAWRATICDISIRSIDTLFGRISHGDSYDDESVIDATNALNALLTVDEGLLRRSHMAAKGLWTAASSATVTWASIPTMANKAHKILSRCEEVLRETYTETVHYFLDYIEKNNTSMWMPMATELIAFTQQPCFAHCIEDPKERMMICATVRRWMIWTSDEKFLATCYAFISAY